MSTSTDNKRGIVLTEAIIAIGVLAMLFTGATRLLSRSLSGMRAASDQVVATYLAQDATEFLIAKREHNVKSGKNKYDRMTCAPGPYCSLDTTVADIGTGNLVGCTSETNCPLYRTNQNKYTPSQSGNTPTPYNRSIKIETVDFDGDTTIHEGLKVTVTVSWADGPKTFKTTLITTIY